MSKKDTNHNDLDLWSRVTKDIRPIGKKFTKATPKAKKPEVEKISPKYTVPKKSTSNLKISEFKDISFKQAKRMDRGELKVEYTLDLHGMNVAQAHLLLEKCVKECYYSNKRNLLIITGKGLKSPNREGKIRQGFKEWINSDSIRSMILRVSQATQKDGGSGAYYILLKKVK
jgi:DNA-nicking Smr family endonuclease